MCFEQCNAALQTLSCATTSDMINRAIRRPFTHDELRYSLHEQCCTLCSGQISRLHQPRAIKLSGLLTNNPNAEGRPNILAVGDDDQAIFSFSGCGHYFNMLRFTQMYTDVQVITLTQNYRSHADVLHAAAGIATNRRPPKQSAWHWRKGIVAAKNESIKSATIQRQQYKSDVAQFDAVARQIRAYKSRYTAARNCSAWFRNTGTWNHLFRIYRR